MANIQRNIQYINRDFSSFRTRLIEYSKTYFPDTYNDFSPSSPGMLFMEQAAYVGDVLSFYLDNQLQENFIQYAQQANNVFDLAYMFGYKPKISTAASVIIDFYQQVPSKLSGSVYIPDYDYALTVRENTPISSQTGTSFIIEDKIDFAVSSSQDPTEISVYQISGETPQYFLLKKSRKAVSSTINTQTFTFTTPTPFSTVDISSPTFLKILDVVDSDGNIWYEVDHLGQEMVLDSIKNTNINDPNKVDNVPYILKLKKAQRRFATRIRSNTLTQIQFGAGTSADTDEEITPNPNNVGIGLPFEKDKLTAAYSPVNFLYTGTYGIAPSNTILTVRYLTGGGVTSNININTLTLLDSTNVNFSQVNLNPSTATYVFNSISCTNPIAARGGKAGDTIEEIRQNTLALIASQKRSVTADDYLIRSLSMPSDYGAVSKAYIEQPKLTDNQVSTIETLNLYVLSQNDLGTLDYATQTLKDNLRTYLSQYRMIGDNIEIRDAYIINIAVDFEIIVLPEFNNNEVLFNCINAVKNHFNTDNWQLNQPIILRDIYILLNRIRGVQTVKTIDITNKAGTASGYSQYAYDIVGATQNQIIYPSLDPSIFEVKYPNQDIKGKVVPLEHYIYNKIYLMAVYKIFPTQDTTLYSAYPVMNTGLNAICEVSNILDLDLSPGVARYITQFDNTEIQDIINNKISGNSYDIFLRNFIAEAEGVNTNVSLQILPVAQSWNNGTGYYLDIPQETDGASWSAANFSGSGVWSMSGSIGGFAYTGSDFSGNTIKGGGNWFTTSSFLVTQSFGLRSVKDIEADVSNTVNAWYSSSIPNYGFIVKLSSSFEFNSNENIQPQLKYYAVDTNTIYPPCLEFRWRDYSTVLTGSATGSIVTTSNIKMSLSENPGTFFPESVNRFYVNVSPLYPIRVYQTASLFTNLNYLPTSSYYAIKDLATNEYVINFDNDYTQISSDSLGNYFDVYMSGLEPERYYKILIKTLINDSTLIFDDHYYFKVING